MAESDSGKRPNRAGFLLLLLLAAGLLLRIIYIVQLQGSDLGAIMSLDSGFYRETALTLASGGGLKGGAMTFNPLYPAFLVVVFRLFGESFTAVRILQSLIGLATVYLLFAAGRRLAPARPKGVRNGNAVGLAAAALAVLYPQLILYEGILLATTLVTFLLTASFTLALVIDQEIRGVRPCRQAGRRVPLWLSSLVLGALLGAGGLGRPNVFFILIPALSIWLPIRGRGRGRNGLLAGALCLLGALAVLSPPVVYSSARAGRFVPVTAHGGINFYIGNHPGGDGTYHPPEGMRTDMRGVLEDSRSQASRELERELTDAEASDYWLRRTIGEVADDPAGWLRLLGRKLLLYWNGVEIADVLDISFYRESCPVLGIIFLSFTILSPLAAAGLFVLFRGGENRSVFLLFTISAVLSVMLFYVNSRYRLPSVPILILPGALFAVRIPAEAARLRWKAVLPPAAVFAAFLLLVSSRDMVEVNRSAGFTFLGNFYVENRQEEKAERAFAEAFRLDPGRIEAQINYARILRIRNEGGRAEELYRKAYGKRPDFPHLALEYGSLLERIGRREEAKRLYLYAFSLDNKRDRVLACQLLARFALAEGIGDEAAGWIRKALEIVPGDKKLLEMLQELEGGG